MTISKGLGFKCRAFYAPVRMQPGMVAAIYYNERMASSNCTGVHRLCRKPVASKRTVSLFNATGLQQQYVGFKSSDSLGQGLQNVQLLKSVRNSLGKKHGLVDTALKAAPRAVHYSDIKTIPD